jgi:signal peptidase I
LTVVPAAASVVLLILRLFGLVIPFAVPTGSMTPAVSAGDHVLMENLTFQFREPRRGDVVVFKTEGLPGLRPGERYIKRVAGDPGDRLYFSNAWLFINDQPVALSNAWGRIAHPSPPHMTAPMTTNVTVPAGGYFLLGDNAPNSLDSRFFGSVPGKYIVGRIWFCCWPPQRMGVVK